MKFLCCRRGVAMGPTFGTIAVQNVMFYELVGPRMAGVILGLSIIGYIVLRLVARPALSDIGLAMEQLSKANREELDTIANCRREAIYDVETHDSEGHNVAGRKTLAEMSMASTILGTYTDVVVDISGMPRGAFFPLLAYLLRLADKNEFRNLHAAVVEDPVLDAKYFGGSTAKRIFSTRFAYKATTSSGGYR